MKIVLEIHCPNGCSVLPVTAKGTVICKRCNCKIEFDSTEERGVDGNLSVDIKLKVIQSSAMKIKPEGFFSLEDDEVKYKLPPNIYRIQKLVANLYDLDISALVGKERTSGLTQARHLAMYLCRRLTGNSTVVIGREFGNRDHSTVLYGINKITKTISGESTPGAILMLQNIRVVEKYFKEEI